MQFSKCSAHVVNVLSFCQYHKLSLNKSLNSGP